MSDYIVGHIRTYTPMVVGWALTWLGDTFGILIPEDASAALITGIAAFLSALYYGLVRLLAERWPWAGNLLIVNKAPAYTPPPV